MSHDAETSGGLGDGGEVVDDHARSAGVLWECMRLCCCLSKCGRQPDSESVYCCCIRSARRGEKEVGRVVVGEVAVRVAEQPVAAEELDLGSEFVVPGS